MATTVTGSIKLALQLADVRTAVTGSSKEGGSISVSGDYGWTITSGTAAGSADRLWADTRTVATGATDTIDLYGTLTNAFAQVVTFVKCRAIVVFAAAANTTTLQVARPAANGALLFAAVSDALCALSAGGFFCWADPAAGFTVTDTTGDLLSIINSAGASASYEIAIVGTSA